MYTYAYGICLLVSVLIWILIACRGYEKINPYTSTAFIIIVIVNLGYWLKSMVLSQEAAMICFCICYFDSTVLLSIMILSMLKALDIKTGFSIKFLAYGTAFLHLFIVWTSIHNSNYYDTITIIHTNMGNVTKVTYGPLLLFHTVYLSLLIAIFSVLVIVAYVKKGRYSKRTLYIYTVGIFVGLMAYLPDILGLIQFSLLPFVYVITDVFLVYNFERSQSHDLTALTTEYQNDQAVRGLVAVDTQMRFLSCNDRAYDFLPELREQVVDEPLMDGSEFTRLMYPMMYAFEKEGFASRKFQTGDITCIAEIHTFTIRANEPKRGYVYELRDATEEQKALDLVNSYNESLNRQVQEATRNIRSIQNKVVAGMANMVENRDNNTGGHVKRTSDTINILVGEIRRQGLMDIDDAFADDIMRAAPMHDLGKIIVENSILNKPGKLTDEEYEIMKMHSTKSGEMVMILLDGVEEEHFVKVAYNVARYHHERWDGRGYPEGLVGSMTPIEARVMAVVDVYDALVSKRAYKEPFSFEKAAQIMCEGMGTQFDPNMKAPFLGCKAQLEAYYTEINAQG
ncbi:HD domain-containing phosphohydrolase [Oribacterium sp. NK2B42]|uniref:HD domain-containing phosphohydrolase n=1 Tax=Oribacterium sp. NK2B42 TaxID=689781 RepID=UPI000677766F|nr:HD domain-containing phosphohydrolase [Oribacterium sp. NK2B42]